MEKSVRYLDPNSDPEAAALAHLLMGTGGLETGALVGPEAHLQQAEQLAKQNNLFDLQARIRFIMGNRLAEQGDLDAARRAFDETIALAQKAGNEFQQVLAHNNAAYHALLASDLQAAHEHVDQGFALSEKYGLRVPLQYLYSTRGEIAMAEGQWTEAEEWFQRGIVEAERLGNLMQVANYRANLGLAARGRGDLDSAIVLLEQARREALEASERIPTPHLQSEIDLWLTETYLERGERAAASEALSRAEARLANTNRKKLQEWAEGLRASLRTRARAKGNGRT
jgi:tetratricopeptide (TPR) repeat protein